MDIARHRIDDEFMASHPHRVAMTRESLPQVLAAARTRVEGLSHLAHSAVSAAGIYDLVSPASQDVADALLLAHQALNTLFACAADPNTPTRVLLGRGGPASFAGAPPADAVHCGNWMTAFSLNLVFGDLDALRKLCAFPTAQLRESPSRSAEYRYLFKDALCAYVNRQPDLTDRIIETIKSANAEATDADWKLRALALGVPQAEILWHLSGRDAPKFNDAMRRAVEDHKRFWSRPADDVPGWYGVLALELTGLAAMAKDAGLACDVRSPYLPLSLVRDM